MNKMTEDVLHAILNTDPDSWLTIDGIRGHQWYKTHGKSASDD